MGTLRVVTGLAFKAAIVKAGADVHEACVAGVLAIPLAKSEGMSERHRTNGESAASMLGEAGAEPAQIQEKSSQDGGVRGHDPLAPFLQFHRLGALITGDRSSPLVPRSRAILMTYDDSVVFKPALSLTVPRRGGSKLRAAWTLISLSILYARGLSRRRPCKMPAGAPISWLQRAATKRRCLSGARKLGGRRSCGPTATVKSQCFARSLCDSAINPARSGIRW